VRAGAGANPQRAAAPQQDEQERVVEPIDGALDWRTGNTSLTQLTGNAVTQYRKDRSLVFALVHGELGVQNGAVFISKDLEHLRYRYSVTDILDMEVYGQHDRDQFRRLALRAVGGIGPRFHIVAEKRLDFWFAGSYMLEYEKLGTGAYVDSGVATLVSRVSAYAVFAIRMNDRISAGFTGYIQPRFGDIHDVRMLAETQFAVKATKHVALALSITASVDSQPPANVLPLDTETKTTVSVSF
jgi:hypothetical protein